MELWTKSWSEGQFHKLEGLKSLNQRIKIFFKEIQAQEKMKNQLKANQGK